MLPVPSPGGGRIFCHDYSYRGPTYNDSLFLRGIVRSRSRLTRRDSDQAADPPESWTRRPTVVTPHGPRLMPAQRVSTGAREERRGTWDAQDLRQSQHSAKGDSKKTGNPLTGAFTRPQTLHPGSEGPPQSGRAADRTCWSSSRWAAEARGRRRSSSRARPSHFGHPALPPGLGFPVCNVGPTGSPRSASPAGPAAPAPATPPRGWSLGMRRGQGEQGRSPRGPVISSTEDETRRVTRPHGPADCGREIRRPRARTARVGFRPFFLFFLIFFFFSQLGCFQAQKRLWRLNRGTSRRGRICLRKMESLKKLKRKGGGRGRGAYSRSISSPSWTETTGSQAPNSQKRGVRVASPSAPPSGVPAWGPRPNHALGRLLR